MTFKKCERAGCTGDGALMPQLVIWASDDPDRAEKPVRINLVFHVCADHAKTLTVTDYLGDGPGFQAIAHLFWTERAKQPGWETAKIVYAHIQNAAMN